MLVVIALGGHAIAPPGAPLDIATQRAQVEKAVDAITAIAREHDVVVTHGNGPQVGLLAAQQNADPSLPSTPLDVLGAESDGMIGYLLESELRRRLPEREIATLLTQVEVSLEDPAFRAPDKPIGPATADGKRRRVASPKPIRILELTSIRKLVEANVVLVCAGGGGIPVARDGGGELRGVEAVVDKDFTSQLLAEAIGADALLLLTDQPAVFADWPTAQQPIERASVEALREMPLEAGSMAPKVAAACRFAESTGQLAVIGALESACDMLYGKAGTTVCADPLRREPEGESP